ncbi:MAG: pilus assembly protein [Gemmatimonadetes bacterium]|nr:pilus assembly protein [Gemmatimonadota bacterium]
MPRRAVPAVVRALRDDRGAAMLEFAIVAPLLVTLVFGAIDVGRYFFLYHALLNAARDGARLAAVSPMGTAAEVTAATTQVVDAVRARIPDSRAATAAVTVALQGAAPAQSVRVSVTAYPFARVVPFVVPTTLPLVRAEFRHEYQ